MNKRPLVLTSFGFKYPPTPEASFLLDVRCLPNPFWETKLKGFSGLDQPIQDYFATIQPIQDLIDSTAECLTDWLHFHLNSSTGPLTIAIGCTGGQHRSVYVVECLGVLLMETLGSQFDIHTQHRDRLLWKSTLG